MNSAKASGANTDCATESAQTVRTAVHTPNIATSERLICEGFEDGGMVTPQV